MGFPVFNPVSCVPGVIFDTAGSMGYGVIHQSTDSVPTSDCEYFIRSYDFRTGAIATLFDVRGLNANYIIDRMWATPIGNFVTCRDTTTNQYTLYRAAAGNWATWTECHKIGWDGTKHIAGVRYLKGFAYSKKDNVIYTGDYSNIAGGINNEWLITIGSINASGTYSQLSEYNRSAVTLNSGDLDTRHIHGINVEQDTGLVVFSWGDSGNQAQVWEWDPDIGVWANDVTGVALNDRAGFRVQCNAIHGQSGGDRTRPIEVSFTPDYLYYAADSHGPEGGIYRIRRSDFTLEKCDSNYNDLFPAVGSGYLGWSSLTLKDGRVIAAMIPYDGSLVANDQSFIRIYGNEYPGSKEFVSVGMLHIHSISKQTRVEKIKYIDGTDRVMISFREGAGTRIPGTANDRTVFSTVVIKLSVKDFPERRTHDRGFKEERPDTYWPVRFVGPGGNNANDGISEFSKWETIEYALEQASALTWGTRVMVDPGVYVEDSIAARWDVSVGGPVKAGEPVVVSAVSPGDTVIYMSGAAAHNEFFDLDQNNHVLELQDLVVGSLYTDAFLYAGHNSNSTGLVLRGTNFGMDGANVKAAVTQREGRAVAIRSQIQGDPSATSSSSPAIDLNLSNTSICKMTLISSVVGGGYSPIRAGQPNTTLEMACTLFRGDSNNRGVFLAGTALVELWSRSVAHIGTKYTDYYITTPPAITDTDYIYSANSSSFTASNVANLITSGAVFQSSDNWGYAVDPSSTTYQSGETAAAIKTRLAPILNSSRFMMDADLYDMGGTLITGRTTIGSSGASQEQSGSSTSSSGIIGHGIIG